MSHNERLFLFVCFGLGMLSLWINYGSELLGLPKSFPVVVLCLVLAAVPIGSFFALFKKRHHREGKARISSEGEIFWCEGFPFEVSVIASYTSKGREGIAYAIGPHPAEIHSLRIRSEGSYAAESERFGNQLVLFFPGREHALLLIPSDFSLEIHFS
ncbi:MAG: hypothetical protein K0S07_625 [Chlamydiales bacterium]|jgi:hypothetical protein|nr:hypothetical protein [Chlamydiales bacterium]